MGYKVRILEILIEGPKSREQLVRELKIKPGGPEYWDFLRVLDILQSKESGRPASVGVAIKVDKSVTDERRFYYLKRDETRLEEEGVIGPERKQENGLLRYVFEEGWIRESDYRGRIRGALERLKPRG